MRRRLALPVTLLTTAVVAVLLPLAVTPPAGAAPSGPLFTPLSGDRAVAGRAARVTPRTSRAFEVDLRRLAAVLAAAPSARELRTGARPVAFSLPSPDGTTATFRIRETAVMEPALAARHPELRTYAGRGVSQPGATIRLDLTPMGFHASVRSPSGIRSWYVDPAVNRRGTTTHLVYARSAVPAPQRPLVEPDLDEVAETPPARAGEEPGAVVQRRTYRLALVTDPTYAAYFGTQNVLAEKVTLMNRVNQVYNDDLAIRMLLVEGTERLNLDTDAKAIEPNGPCGASACYESDTFYPDGTEGDTPDGCSSALLDRNEFVLGQIIGADNFDIGHIGLGINGGGIAGLGVVGEQYKADGCTGLPFPEGDFYAIDYVAHEIGHQFAGNHTFNGTEVNCSLTNRAGEASVEPGSGSSVMAYAGICGRDDLQPHTDPYFSQRSIDEITAHVTAEPSTYDEQQVVNLRGFDTSGESFQLTYPGADPVTITRGGLTGNYHELGIALAVQQLTGVLPEVSGYDGALSPSPAGFTLDFALMGAGTNLDTLGVVGVSEGVDGFVGTIYNGGPGTNQGTTDSPGNHAPSVTAPADRTIPVQTPFALTASGHDVDGNDLTYLWEQNDTGPATPNGGTLLLSNDKTNGPLFRVFGEAAQVSLADSLQSPAPGINLADGNPTRVFPDLEQVLAGNTNAATGDCPAPPADAAADVPQATVDCYSEYLPTSSYGVPVLGGELSFRVTARDADPDAGGTAHDDVTLSVDPEAGPLLVTSRATPGTPGVAGQAEEVTWQVNGTDALASAVRITMATAEGGAFDTVLLESTPNDGAATVTLPNLTTEHARIKVEAVDNYFFAVNAADFAVQGPISVEDPGVQQVAYSDQPGTLVTASSDDADGDHLTASIGGVEELFIGRLATSEDGVRPGTADFQVVGGILEPVGTAAGLLTVQQTDPASVAQRQIDFQVVPEDAAATYTGPTTVPTSGNSAPVELEAEVADPDDGFPGDIRTATVTFVDRADDSVLCTAPVTGTALLGSASCTAELPRNGESTQHTIGTVVGGNYSRDAAADDVVVTVVGDGTDTEPPTTSITGGPKNGRFVLKRAVGFTYAGAPDATGFECTLDGKDVACADGGKVSLGGLRTGGHTFTVAARDAAGNVDATPARRTFGLPYAAKQLDRRGDWDLRRSPGAYLGRYLQSSDKGASVSRRLEDVTNIALVVGKRPGGGALKVLFAGKEIGTVPLDARRTRERVLVTWVSGNPRSGLLKVVSTNGRPVRVEGLGGF